jgi:hypothetical protein
MSTCSLCDFLLTDKQIPGSRWIKADSLIASAANGCEGCNILQQGVTPFVKGWSAAEEGGSVYQVSFSRKFDRDVLRCMVHVHQRHEQRDEQIKFEYYTTEGENVPLLPELLCPLLLLVWLRCPYAIDHFLVVA